MVVETETPTAQGAETASAATVPAATPSGTQVVEKAVDAVDENLAKLESLLAEPTSRPDNSAPSAPAEASVEATAAAPADASLSPAPEPVPQETPAQAEVTQPEGGTNVEPPKRRSVVAVLQDAGSVGLTLAREVFIRSILALDRPFGWLSPRMKSVVGYVALATFLVALATWVFGTVHTASGELPG